MLRASFLIPQRYFLAVGAGPVPAPPAARSLRRALRCFIRCTAACSLPGRGRPSTSSTSPPGLCSVPQSLFSSVTSSLWVPGPHRHCRLTAHSVASPAHTGALSDTLQRVPRQAGGETALQRLLQVPWGVLRALFLVPQRYFLVMDAGPAQTPPVDRAFRRALSAHGRFVRCTVLYSPPGRGETALQRPLQVPWGRALCLVPHSRCYFLVMGAGPAPSLPADRALRCTLSAHRHFIRCTAACSLPSRGKIALQRPPLASAGAAGRIASPRKSPA
ncbi:hypothetical protein NDU88_005854 [Pleurodeles waltl]|uniref:Uncharacterized protein n=1 Tax=Pleurodeles waltl TaxID=8319 RepID=A0AAV7N5I6_PLEWA|nr:hypothetical protein NDU88_005854 [Pleurodeles waltl]